MSDKTQKVVTQVLTILAAVGALAISAAPAASAGPSTAKAPPPGAAGFSIDIGTSEKVKRGLKGIVTNNNDPDKLGAVRVRDTVWKPQQEAVVYNGHAGLGANIIGRKS